MSTPMLATVDEETYEYVLDKGPMTTFSLTDGGALESVSSLRVMGLRKGFSEHNTLPGHYVLNTWTGEEKATGVQVLEAPAMLHFKDRGLAPAFLLEWKWFNDKLYAQVLPTTLKVGNSGDPDKADKWLTTADVRPVRFSLIETVQSIENREGIPLKRNLDAWLLNHSGDRRKALALTSLSAHAKWCSYESFKPNFAKLASVMHTEMEKSIRQSSKSLQPASIESAIAKSREPLSRMVDMLSQHVDLIGIPLSFRFLELEIDPEVELQDAHNLVKQGLAGEVNSEKAADLCQQLTSERLKCFKDGSLPSVDSMSPVHMPATRCPNPPPPAEESPTPTIARQLEFDASNSTSMPTENGSKNKPTETETSTETSADSKKRTRMPTNIFEPESKKKDKQNKKNSANSDASLTDQRPRKYHRSGLYSKDPIKAALARKKLQGPERLSQEKKGGGVTGPGAAPSPLSIRVCAHIVCAILCIADKEGNKPAGTPSKELKAKIKEMEGTIAMLRAELASVEAKTELKVNNKALEVELDMRKRIELAYEKGFKSCKEQLMALRELQNSLH